MANITLQTIESLPLVEEINENISLVGWDGEKTVRVAKDMVGGSELPEAGAYKQLVTDANGNWVAADQLAWKDGETVHTIPTEYLPKIPGATVYTYANNYLYKGDYIQREKVTKEELATAAQNGSVVLKDSEGTQFYPAIVEIYASNDYGMATAFSYNPEDGSPVSFTVHTAEWVSGPV